MDRLDLWGYNEQLNFTSSSLVLSHVCYISIAKSWSDEVWLKPPIHKATIEKYVFTQADNDAPTGVCSLWPVYHDEMNITL